MYKIMIIDDEPIIVQGLSRTIDWEKFECQIIATAYDGMEGAEAIRKYRPDIIISDIAMPGLDGLSMVAGLKSEFPDMEISILTGYRVFDYAQKAVNLGVTRFLLKPSNMKELEEAIVTMVNNLKAKKISSETSLQSDRGSVSDNVASSFIVKNAILYIEKNYADKQTEFVNIDFLNKEGLLYHIDQCEEVAKYFKEQKVDAIFIINCNFGNEEAAGRIAQLVGKPVLLWGP
ncbi:MAG: response regulator, partial [Clostridiales bacterium]|nr:response regulator [Clostridiales bacterium]